MLVFYLAKALSMCILHSSCSWINGCWCLYHDHTIWGPGGQWRSHSWGSWGMAKAHPNVCREIGQLFLMQTKNDVIQGATRLGQNDVTWGQAKKALACHPSKWVNKAEEQTYLSANIGWSRLFWSGPPKMMSNSQKCSGHFCHMEKSISLINSLKLSSLFKGITSSYHEPCSHFTT